LIQEWSFLTGGTKPRRRRRVGREASKKREQNGTDLARNFVTDLGGVLLGFGGI